MTRYPGECDATGAVENDSFASVCAFVQSHADGANRYTRRREGGRAGHGVQADRIGAAPLTDGQRTAPGSARARVALVRAGATFVNGKLVERPGDPSPEASSPPAALEDEVAKAA